MEATIALKTITAPFAGRLGLRHVEQRAICDARAGRWSGCKSLDPIWIDFPVPKSTSASSRSARRSSSAADAYPGETFKGEIEAFDASSTQDTRMLMVRARVPKSRSQIAAGHVRQCGVLAGRAEGAGDRAAYRGDLRPLRRQRVGGEGGPGRAGGAPPPMAKAEPVASAVAADATPTVAIPAPTQAHRGAPLRAGGTERGRPGRHSRRHQAGRAGGHQRPAQIAARRHHQDRQFRRAEGRRRSCRSSKSHVTSPISSSSGRCWPGGEPVDPAGRGAGRLQAADPPIPGAVEHHDHRHHGLSGRQCRSDPGLHHRADPAGGGERRRHRHAHRDSRRRMSARSRSI